MTGNAGRLNIITDGMNNDGFNWNDRYNILSGIIAGFFLQLSYFGTDQSQVGRYLTARSTTESRLGLLLNGLVKIPLQFLILMIGIFIFVHYQFHSRPVYFNTSHEQIVAQSPYAAEYNSLKGSYEKVQQERNSLLAVSKDIEVIKAKLPLYERGMDSIRGEMGELVKRANPSAAVGDKDANYVFLRFVGDNLPSGLVGLIIAIIFLAAWGSIAAALNSLASSTIIDLHKPFVKTPLTPTSEYKWSKRYTLLWGLFSMVITFFATDLGNSLVEAVNILGSWFYGTLLGIFLVAFYLKRVKGNAVFYAAIISEIVVIIISFQGKISFLWFTIIGALTVMIAGYIFQVLNNYRNQN